MSSEFEHDYLGYELGPIEGELDVAGNSPTVTRTVETNESGAFETTVATPGTHMIESSTVTVTAENVTRGDTVAVKK